LLFAASNAAVYEQLMGRWSARLAPAFIAFAAIENAGRILDVGCGTGSLSFALAKAMPQASIVGIDCSQAYVDYGAARSPSARLAFQCADATALPFADGAFDAALALLVLNFVADAEKAAWEMRRVTRPGGVVAASVWDFRGGLPHHRIFLDTAAALDPIDGQSLRSKALSGAFTGPGELAAMWTKMGLRDIAQTTLAIRLDFQSFADYWQPWLGGQGMIGPYLASLSDEEKALIEHHVRLGYLVGGADGPRSFAATAWAARGIR
jgi:SAM-dependent methyltransferase